MGTQDEGGGETAAPDPKKDNIYENRGGSKKIIRVVTVIAYMVSVSFAAIVLSAYYVFLWQPPNPRLMHRAHLRASPQVEYLVDKPPVAVPQYTPSPEEIRDKVNFFREEILRIRPSNISFRSPYQQQDQQLQGLEDRGKDNNNTSNVKRVINLTNETVRNNSKAMWSPIIRALLATTEASTARITLENSTSVYNAELAMNGSTLTDSHPTSEMFTATPEINGSSTTGVSSSSSALSSSPTASFSSSTASSLLESRGKLYKTSVNDLPFTTAAAFTTGNKRNRKEDRSSERISEKSSSVTESSIKGLGSTRANELLLNLPGGEADLDRVGSSGIDQPVDGTTIEDPDSKETTSVDDFGPFGKSSHLQLVQGLNRTTTVTDREVEVTPTVSEFTDLNTIVTGPQTTRLSIRPSINDTESLEKLRTISTPDKQVPIEIVPDSSGDLEPVLNSPASIVPAVVQPDPDSFGKEQETKERLTQHGDFAFV